MTDLKNKTSELFDKIIDLHMSELRPQLDEFAKKCLVEPSRWAFTTSVHIPTGKINLEVIDLFETADRAAEIRRNLLRKGMDPDA